MEKNKLGYNIFKYLIGSIFLLYYRPKFTNKNVIPKEGPILLCGNHIHLYDQCLPILSTKRMLHYMAKKEYFDSKFSWFFKCSGCISVDRENHGGNSKEIAQELLEHGYGIGIYPEGTRNSLVCKDDKLNEIYQYFKDEISMTEFKKLMKKNQTRVTQSDLLLKLYKDKLMILEASNSEYETRYYNEEDVLNHKIQILGKVLKVKVDF